MPPPPPDVPSSVGYDFRHKRTGEPLRFEATDKTRMVTESYPVGEHKIFDREGRYIGKDVVMGQRKVERTFHQWHVYQGKTEIDAISALDIVRDQAFEKAYEAEVARVKQDHGLAMELYETDVKAFESKKNVGLALGIVGIAGMVGAGLIGLATRDPNADTTPTATMVAGVAGLGFMGLTIGGFYMRQSATRDEAAAMSKAEHFANSRLDDSAFSKFAQDEKHVRDAVEKAYPPPKEEPPPEPPPAVAENANPSEPAEEPKSMPMMEIRMAKDMQPFMTGAIADNKKLGKAILGLWSLKPTGDGKAREVFEEEFLKSRLYWNDLGGQIALHQGNLLVYADSASLAAAEGKNSKAKSISAVELISFALAFGRGIYVHYEGEASVFAVITAEDEAKMLKKLGDLADKKKR